MRPEIVTKAIKCKQCGSTFNRFVIKDSPFEIDERCYSCAREYARELYEK